MADLKPRKTRTRARVLRAAAQILERGGYSQLTMERVAAESGAAKTTLYRRWPTKAALCMDLYLDIAGRELEVPDMVVHLQTRTVAGPALLGLISEALVTPQARRAFLAEFAERRREVTRTVLERAIKRREIRRDTDIDLVIDALGGAVTFRLLQGHAPLSTKFTNALVKLILSGCITKEAR
jgi:AcrR family transcriptional regulator